MAKQLHLPNGSLAGPKEVTLLALCYLGTLYTQLDECACNIIRSVGRYDVVSYVDANFVQLFM